MSTGVDTPEAGRASTGRALALLALAPIAIREADRREQLERREREREEEAERARLRHEEMEKELAKLPVFPRPNRPSEPFRVPFDWDRFAPTLWLIPVFLIFVGNWVSGKTIFDSGYPWGPMLLVPVGLAALNGAWPMLGAMRARERFRGKLAEYEAAIAVADRRDLERAEVEKRFGAADDESSGPPAATSSAGAREPSEVRTDGCYVSDERDYHYFVRFFADGGVMTVTVGGTDEVDADLVRSVMGWLVPSGHDGLSKGRFTRSGSEISFSATSSTGTVNYKGTILPGGEELRLRSHSLINGHRDERQWRFQAA